MEYSVSCAPVLASVWELTRKTWLRVHMDVEHGYFQGKHSFPMGSNDLSVFCLCQSQLHTNASWHLHWQPPPVGQRVWRSPVSIKPYHVEQKERWQPGRPSAGLSFLAGPAIIGMCQTFWLTQCCNSTWRLAHYTNCSLFFEKFRAGMWRRSGPETCSTEAHVINQKRNKSKAISSRRSFLMPEHSPTDPATLESELSFVYTTCTTKSKAILFSTKWSCLISKVCIFTCASVIM